MKDYIVRATAGNTQIRAFAAVTTNLVEEGESPSSDKSGCNSSSGTASDRWSHDGKHDEE